MELLTYVLFAVHTCNVAVYAKVRFDGYKVYSVQIDTDEQYQAILASGSDYSIWKDGGTSRLSDIMVSPNKESDFHELTLSFNVQKSLKIENVQRYNIILEYFK